MLRHRLLTSRASSGFGWHVPKLPGLGDVDWGEFFAALTDIGYDGPGLHRGRGPRLRGSLDDRKRALVQSKKYLEQFQAPAYKG